MTDKADLNREIADELGYYADLLPSGYPNWAESVDAALSLPVELGQWALSVLPLSHCIGRMACVAELRAYNPRLKKSSYYDQSGVWEGQSSDLAVAVCRAWLAYRRAAKP